VPDPVVDELDHVREREAIGRWDGMEYGAFVIVVAREHAVDDGGVDVAVQIQRSAKTMLHRLMGSSLQYRRRSTGEIWCYFGSK
jgi:hypothetical protein